MPSGFYKRIRKDYSGQKFNDWTILKFDSIKKGNHLWLAQCVCGEQRKVFIGAVVHGISMGCGCSHRERTKLKMTKHGMFKHPLYGIFIALKARCENPKNNKYSYYGERGIKCLWKTPQSFVDDMYESYMEHKKNNRNTSIDRIDNNGNYCKENCRWATAKEQANNTRWNLKNRLVN